MRIGAVTTGWLAAAAMVAAVGVPAIAGAQEREAAEPNPLGPQSTPGFNADELPVGDDGPPEVEPPSPPAAPATPEQIAAWRRDLVGKPAFGPGGGRIGTVTELTVALDNRVNAAVVTTPGGIRLPVPWRWVARQVGNRTVVVPWSAAEIAWLQGRRQ